VALGRHYTELRGGSIRGAGGWEDAGLRKVSQVMVGKAAPVPRARIGGRMGSVDAATMQAVSKAVI
jgi:mRNA-degrading endonuclease toxin of MazEF toxin-antitoxin module